MSLKFNGYRADDVVRNPMYYKGLRECFEVQGACDLLRMGWPVHDAKQGAWMLISCVECGARISDRALSCPKCGMSHIPVSVAAGSPKEAPTGHPKVAGGEGAKLDMSQMQFRRSTEPRQIGVGKSAVVFAVFLVLGSAGVYFAKGVMGGLGIGGSTAKSQAQTIYSSSPQAAERLIRQFAVGTWTNSSRPGAIWYRITVAGNGEMTWHIAFPTDDGWGDPQHMGELIPATGKYQDTGKRWYGFHMKLRGRAGIAGNTPFTFIIAEDGSLRYFDPDERGLPLIRGESFPFSR